MYVICPSSILFSESPSDNVSCEAGVSQETTMSILMVRVSFSHLNCSCLTLSVIKRWKISSTDFFSFLLKCNPIRSVVLPLITVSIGQSGSVTTTASSIFLSSVILFHPFIKRGLSTKTSTNPKKLFQHPSPFFVKKTFLPLVDILR